MSRDKLIFGIALLIQCTLVQAQNPSRESMKRHLDSVHKEVQKYRQIDYLKYPYKYLDDNLNIIISNETFDSILIANEYYSDRIQRYKDSIRVVLCGEFESDIQQRVAYTSLTMSWLRVSYYIWISESDTRNLGERYSFQYPYELYDYIYYHQNEWDNYMCNFIEKLKNKVIEETGNNEVITMDHSKFLGYALRSNPKRIKDFEKVKEERRAQN